jgi:putative restriction endonuclease
VLTSWKSPYPDETTADGFLYAYRAGTLDQPDNRALRAAHELRVPIVYFVGTRPLWYRALYPCFVTADDPASRRAAITSGVMAGPMDEREPALIVDVVEREYALRDAKVRHHQGRLRGLVLPAYGDHLLDLLKRFSAAA